MIKRSKHNRDGSYGSFLSGGSIITNKFDSNGNIKRNYEINGIVKDVELNLYVRSSAVETCSQNDITLPIAPRLEFILSLPKGSGETIQLFLKFLL